MSLPTRRDVVATVSGRPFETHRVLDPAAADILSTVRRLTMAEDAAPGPFKFPGPLPVSLERADVPKVRTEDYVACEKTDGTRFALVCVMQSGLKIAALVGRGGDVSLLPLRHVPKAMFQGTVLDGELAFEKPGVTHPDGRFVFVIFDAVAVSGVAVGHMTLYERLRAVKVALSHHRADPKDPATLEIKSYVSMRAPMLVRSHLDAQSARFDVDGIVFTPCADPVRFGRHRGLFKLKSKHTVDFLVGRTGRGPAFLGGPALMVYDHQSRVNTVVGVLAKSATNGSMNEYPPEGTVVECTHSAGGDERYGEWNLVAVRADKTTANDLETYRRTMFNMRENMCLDDVLG